MTSPNRRQLLLASLSEPTCARAASSPQVIYLAPETPRRTRAPTTSSCCCAALERALATHGPYRLAPASQFMTLTRVLRRAAAMANHGGLGVAGDQVRAAAAHQGGHAPWPAGLRLLLIRAHGRPSSTDVRTLADLRRFSLGQGELARCTMFEALGIKVVRSAHYRTMFPKILMADRFDAFPRGVNEAFDEQQLCGRVARPRRGQRASVALSRPFHFVVG